VTTRPTRIGFRRAVLIVGFLNLAYFCVEIVVARLIGAVSLYSDSVDFLEDASINILIFLAITWSARARSRLAMGLAVVVLMPAAAALWTAGVKVGAPMVPEAEPLTLTAGGALVVNIVCALILVRHRQHGGGLAIAAWLAARNDSFASLAIIGAGILTATVGTAWPDVAVGLGLAALNVGAAREVWRAARTERSTGYPARPEADSR
jgi:Co/Zn/Cd efflux system component